MPHGRWRASWLISFPGRPAARLERLLEGFRDEDEVEPAARAHRARETYGDEAEAGVVDRDSGGLDFRDDCLERARIARLALDAPVGEAHPDLLALDGRPI